MDWNTMNKKNMLGQSIALDGAKLKKADFLDEISADFDEQQDEISLSKRDLKDMLELVATLVVENAALSAKFDTLESNFYEHMHDNDGQLVKAMYFKEHRDNYELRQQVITENYTLNKLMKKYL